MAYNTNRYIVEPKDDDSLWRYMSFTKFISLFESQKMYFANVKEFDDRFEGAFPPSNENILLQAEEFERRSAMLEAVKGGTMVSCWHHNVYESDALWKLYGLNSEGIAIKTTFKRLRESFRNANEEVFIGKVRYLPPTDSIPEDELAHWPLSTFFYKRMSFTHENEVRVIHLPPQSDSSGNKGGYIDTDLGCLIEELYISPTSQSWFEGLVRQMVEKYKNNYKGQHKLDFQIYKSPLYTSF